MTLHSIAILKPGTFTDESGKVVTFSRRDLEDVAASYNSASDPAPLVIGHPKTDAPAYGWVERLEMVGDTLRALAGQIAPKFGDAVKAGRYRKVSPSLYLPTSRSNPRPGHLYLKHVGFLGGAAPAIKGLGTVAFGEVSNPGSVAIVGGLGEAVSFAAPAGYTVLQDNIHIHTRAREIQVAGPDVSFWSAFQQARAEDHVASLAARPAATTTLRNPKWR